MSRGSAGRQASPGELVAEPAEPLVGRNAVRTELLDPVLLFAGEERAMRRQLAGVRGESSKWPESVGLIWNNTRISNSRRIWWVKQRFRLFTVVAPDDHVHAQDGPFAQNRIEVVGGAGVFLAFREAEVVFAAAEVAEPRQIVDEQE